MKLYVLAAGALAAFVAGGTVAWNVQAWRMDSEVSDLRAAHATALATAVQAESDKAAQRAAALQKESDDAQAREEAARRDAGDARDAGERLRKQLAVARAAACKNPTTSGGGASTGATPDLLADVQRRLDEATDGIARFADGAHNAGRACERSADAVAAP